MTHPFRQTLRLPSLLGRRLDAPFESKTHASPPRSSSPRRTTAIQILTFLVSTPFHPFVETSLRLSTTLRRFAKALERTRARRGTLASHREAPRIGPICGGGECASVSVFFSIFRESSIDDDDDDDARARTEKFGILCSTVPRHR